MGLTKDEIFEFLPNPEKEIKEILFEFNYGSKQVKKYCPNCNELLLPTDIKKNISSFKRMKLKN